MHYTAGLGAVGSFAGARALPGGGFLTTLARVLLDGAGALFGLYLVLALGLAVYGAVSRRRIAAEAASDAAAVALRSRAYADEARDASTGWLP